MVMIDSSSGNRSTEFEYAPFGENIRASGSLVSSCINRYSTKIQDLETGQYYYGHRYYGPSAGRWLSRDPIGEPGFEVLRGNQPQALGDGPGLYSFIQNNTANLFDMLGLTRKLTSAEQKQIDAYIKAIRECAVTAQDRDVLKAINALLVSGIYDENDVKNDPSQQNESDTTAGMFWVNWPTNLAKDYFLDNVIWNDKTRINTLIHEGWHAWKKQPFRPDEEKAYEFGFSKCNSLWDCIKLKLGIK